MVEDNQVIPELEPQPQSEGEQKFKIQPLEKISALVIVLLVLGYVAFAQYMNFWPFKISVAPIATPLASPQGSPSTSSGQFDVLSNWQTYRNEEYGFEFRYPGDWRVDECSKEFIYFNGLCDSDAPYGGVIQINIEISLNAKYIPIDIAGVSAKKYNLVTYGEGPGNPSGLNVWIITFSQKDNNFVLNLVENSKDDFMIYDQILFTFKFIPSTSFDETQDKPLGTSEPNKGDKYEVCIQVITPARNPQTGEIREFPTPCDVPEGWEVIR